MPPAIQVWWECLPSLCRQSKRVRQNGCRSSARDCRINQHLPILVGRVHHHRQSRSHLQRNKGCLSMPNRGCWFHHYWRVCTVVCKLIPTLRCEITASYPWPPARLTAILPVGSSPTHPWIASTARRSTDHWSSVPMPVHRSEINPHVDLRSSVTVLVRTLTTAWVTSP